MQNAHRYTVGRLFRLKPTQAVCSHLRHDSLALNKHHESCGRERRERWLHLPLNHELAITIRSITDTPRRLATDVAFTPAAGRSEIGVGDCCWGVVLSRIFVCGVDWCHVMRDVVGIGSCSVRDVYLVWIDETASGCGEGGSVIGLLQAAFSDDLFKLRLRVTLVFVGVHDCLDFTVIVTWHCVQLRKLVTRRCVARVHLEIASSNTTRPTCRAIWDQSRSIIPPLRMSIWLIHKSRLPYCLVPRYGTI